MPDLSRRSFLKSLGASFAVVALPIGWLATDREPRRFRIAAFDASPAEKARADIVCIGRDDQKVINTVLARGDSVLMSGGTFHIGDAIDLSGTNSSSTITNCHFIGPADATFRFSHA